jgi:hypothetical protein
MAANCLPLLLSALLGADPAAVSQAQFALAPVAQAPVVQAPVAHTYTQTAYASAGYSPTMTGAACEPRFCFDAQEPWLHGYIQEVPIHGGFHAFRPYNYKHALAQSQIAAGWGLSPTSPYSQQYWRRNQGAPPVTEAPSFIPTPVMPATAWQTQIVPGR